MDYIVKDGTPTNDELEHLAFEIGDSWDSLGRRLGFIDAELTAFHKENEKYSEKSYKMLLVWRQRNGPDALYRDLHAALCHRLVSRKDLATKFCCDKGPSSDPSRSVAEGKGLKEAEVGRETNFTIETRNAEGKQFYQEDDYVTVKIRTPKDEEMEKKIEDHKDGKYTVTYTPDSVGQHDVNVNDQPLTGSPWSVQVTPDKYKTEITFGSHGKGQGQFDSPRDIAVSERTGNIAVADYNNNRIQMFSSENEYLREFGRKKIGAGILRSPISVAFTRSGDLIVVHEKKISLFSETGYGQFIKHVINEHLKNPLRVSVGRDGHLIVCDKADNTIKVLSPDGTELLQSYSAPDCDKSPTFAVYHQEKLFVSYELAHCVKVFNNEGVFLYNIGSKGSGDGQLKHPAGLAVDKFNNLIVCDQFNKGLQVFTLDGKFLSKTDQNTAHLKYPRSVAVSQDGHVFVTDLSTNSVHVLK